jgi:hypothetical protein
VSSELLVIVKGVEFLDWCAHVGSRWDEDGFRFPEKPCVKKLRAACLAEFDDPSEEIKAEIAALPDEQLIAWMRGAAGFFLGHVDTAGEGARHEGPQHARRHRPRGRPGKARAALPRPC